MAPSIKLSNFMDRLHRYNPHQPEYIQAVYEVMMDVIPWIQSHPQYACEELLMRLCEPDRIIQFSVCWEDDQGTLRWNRGFRVQGNNAIGPYKGGLRFHPTVNDFLFTHGTYN